MIYLDTSVVLAQLLAEDHRPPASLWSETLVASRLMEYEVWTRLHARKLADSHGESARRLIGQTAFLELSPPVLERALEAFPGSVSVRTLDALHLASCEYLRNQGQSIALASYDHRMTAIARAMNIPLFDLEHSLNVKGGAKLRRRNRSIISQRTVLPQPGIMMMRWRCCCRAGYW